jgi:4,5-dihydroxyphthalate decarboxylase
MSRLQLSFGICNYDHMSGIFDGTIQPAGIDLNVMLFDKPSRIFHRATNFGDFDVCELSFGRQISLVSQQKNEMVAIPVFPSRMGRIGAFYVLSASEIQRPEDLAGKRVGVPEWTMTATVFARGWLSEQIGVDLKSIEWIQAGSEVPGRKEPVDLMLPEGIRITPISDRSLLDMLLSGEIDCLMSAQAPTPFREGDGRIRRLIRNHGDVERDYYRKTGIYPIMHLIAIRRSIYEANPWVALNLYEAFDAAKNRTLTRFPKVNHSAYPVPWLQDWVRDLQADFGKDFWPYGLESNRRTIEAFLRFGFDQGLCHRRVAPEEMFAPQTIKLPSA